jgi:putative ABC transport system permease protein
MEGLVQDVRHSLRALARRPGFALVTVLTLGVGIGASTAIFSAVHAVLLRDLPYANADRVVALFQTDLTTRERTGGVSAANIRDVHEQARQLSPVSVAEPWSLDLAREGRTEALRTWAVSEGFFEVLGVQALLGRTFTADEYVEGQDKVVVLGHRGWVARFGADPAIVGASVTLDNEPHVVVGVLPETFRFPDRAEAWIPRPDRSWDPGARAADFMIGVGLLAKGATRERAQAEVDRLAASLAAAFPDTNGAMGMELVPLREHLFGDVRTPLLVLFGAVAAVFLIACANVAGLMLARGAQRQREFALRGALGASTGRLFRHVGAESAILAAVGCGLGVAVTFGGVRAIQALGPDHLPRIEELSVDGPVLIFAVLLGGLSALLAGMAPSARLSRPDVRETLSEGTRGSTGGRRGTSLRSRLVTAEVAGAVVLLIGAGLLVKSFGVLLDRELGFEPRNRLAVQIFAYDIPSADLVNFVDEVHTQMEAVPGVVGVAITSNLPGATDGALASIDIETPFTVLDRAAPPAGQEPTASLSMVSRGYFDVLDIPILAGRGFESSDDATAPRVIVVSEALVRRHFGGEDAIGERLQVHFGRNPEPAEIVGVAADVRPLGHQSDPRPEVYFPLTQVGTGSLTFVIEADGAPAPLVGPVREAIWAVNPAQSIWGAATLEDLLSDWLKERRFNLFLLSAFAGVALMLAAVGIYGLISFSVEQRVAELGIRRALGGQSGAILGMVVREGMRLAGAGVVLGLLAAVLLTRFLEGMLFGVEPTDPATFAGLSVAVLAVAVAAAMLPAVRAVRVDPMVALRGE